MNGFKTKKIFALLIVALLLFTGCQSTPATTDNAAEQTTVAVLSAEPIVEKEVVLNFNLGADPRTLDPTHNNAIDGSHVINNTFEGLTREINGNLENAMAESIEISDDGMAYIFHLRDAKWSDGTPVTADQFAYAWKRQMTPENAAPYSSHMFYIKNAEKFFKGEASIEDVGVEAVDAKTFKVTLESPTPYFTYLITRPAFMPLRQDIVEASPETWAKDPKTAISNGPFVLAEYALGEKIVLKKNPEYWNADSVKLSQINYMMIVEASTALVAFESGELDVINAIPTQEISRLIGEDNRFYNLPMLGTYYFIFNVNKAPFDDVRVRKALALAIDRESITTNVKRGGEIPATGFNPVGLKDSTGKDFNATAGNYGVETDGGNIAEAQKLLAEAGYPNGEGFPDVSLMYNTSESHKMVCESIQEMWKKNLNIDLKLENQEWAVFQDTRRQGNYFVARGGYIGDYPDPVGLLELFMTESANNDAHWSSAEYDELITQSRYAKGSARDEIIYKAQAILMEEQPITPIYYYTDPVMVQNNIKGWQKNSMSYWYFGVTEIE